MIDCGSFVQGFIECLKAAFPGDSVEPYTNTVPEDFRRPCSYVDVAEADTQPDACDALVLRVRVCVRSFCAVDEYHDTDAMLLYRRAMQIAGGILVRGVRVSDSDTGEERTPLLTLAEQKFGVDFCDVFFTCELHLAAEDFAPSEPVPLMEILTERVETEGP